MRRATDSAREPKPFGRKSTGIRIRRSARATAAATASAVATLACSPAFSATPAQARFQVVGDWGYGSSAQQTIAERMCERQRSRPVDFILTTGDNFYRPNGTATDTNFHQPQACLIEAGTRWRAAWGNHDLGGTSTAEVLGASSRWYRFRAGPAIVVVLDANLPTDANQLAFMRRAIPNAWPGPVIVAFHQPLRSGGLHRPSRVQQAAWEPLLRARRVDLILQGHNHAYERLLVGGIRHITTGGGGAPLYPCLYPVAGLERCEVVFHFLEVTVTPRALDVAVIDADGNRIDRVRVAVKRSE